MKFSIRDLFLVTVIVALVLGWAADRWIFRTAQETQNSGLRLQRQIDRGRIEALERQLREAGIQPSKEY
jgi:hypothetical protein